MAMTDARVKFLRGLQANLPVDKVDGNVYVATDERAMYIDYTPSNSATVERIRIGDIIQYDTWAQIEALPTANYSQHALYYAVDKNILAKWNGTNFQQINAQDIQNIIQSMKWDINAVASGASATIKLEVRKAGINTKIFETPLTYKLASADASVIKITSSQDSNNITTITMRAKDLQSITELSTVDAAYAENEVPLNLYNYQQGTDSSGASVTKPVGLTPTSLLKLVGANATHIKSEAATNTITIRTDISLSVTNFNANGELVLGLRDNVDNIALGSNTTITPIIQVGKTGDTSNIKFVNGTAQLPVYTIAQTDTEIQKALKSADAMTYRGTIGDAVDGAVYQALPLMDTQVRIGDTYKIIKSGDYLTDNTGSGTNTVTAAIGDLFIATSSDGTEDNDGYIPASKIRWTYVPSGDDTQTVKLNYKDSDKTFYLSANGLNNGPKLKFDTTGLAVNTTGTGTQEVVTLSHKAYAAITPANDINASFEVGTASAGYYGDATFTAITGITVDNGHITDIKTGTFKVETRKLSSYSGLSYVYNGSSKISSYTNPAVNTRASIATSVVYADGTHQDAEVMLKSSSLTFTKTAANDDLAIDLMWETF